MGKETKMSQVRFKEKLTGKLSRTWTLLAKETLPCGKATAFAESVVLWWIVYTHNQSLQMVEIWWSQSREPDSPLSVKTKNFHDKWKYTNVSIRSIRWERLDSPKLIESFFVSDFKCFLLTIRMLISTQALFKASLYSSFMPFTRQLLSVSHE